MIKKETLIVTHGTYVGPGCPDPAARLREEDRGFSYDRDHPAQAGERVEDLTPPEVRRMLQTRSFRRPEPVDGQETAA